MRPMSDEELEARLRETFLSTPGRGLDDALRRGKAARARREWAGLARLAAVAAVAWVLSAAAGAAVDRSIATVHRAPGGTVVAERGPGETSPASAIAVVWQRRQIEQMAFEDWLPDWRSDYGGPTKRERDDRQGLFWGKPFEKGCPPDPLPKLFVLRRGQPGTIHDWRWRTCARPLPAVPAWQGIRLAAAERPASCPQISREHVLFAVPRSGGRDSPPGSMGICGEGA